MKKKDPEFIMNKNEIESQNTFKGEYKLGSIEKTNIL